MEQAASLTSFLLTKQIKALEKDFLKQGGLMERMSQARIEVRLKQQ
jgi:four helix bundle suffix protein